MEKNENYVPLLGDRFPEMGVMTTHGKLDLPEHFKGKWFVLFSHPADFTPVCTTEFVAFQNRYEKFRELDTELIGLSVDQVFAHIEWERWIQEKLNVGIEFPIIADTGAVAGKLGLVHPGKGTNTVRAVFVVDPKGLIRQILYYPQELGRNIDEILRSIRAMQISDANGVAMPENWPNNELVADHVIIPPASSVEEVAQREADIKDGKIEAYDWWLCHKKLE